jgi:hypothetical protein
MKARGTHSLFRQESLMRELHRTPTVVEELGVPGFPRSLHSTRRGVRLTSIRPVGSGWARRNFLRGLSHPFQRADSRPHRAEEVFYRTRAPLLAHIVT